MRRMCRRHAGSSSKNCFDILGAGVCCRDNQGSMKRNFLSTGFLMLLCVGVGICLGRYVFTMRPAPPSPPTTTSTPTNESAVIVATTVASVTNTSGGDSNIVKKLSLADVPVAIAAALGKAGDKRTEAFSDIVDSVDAADLPKLM